MPNIAILCLSLFLGGYHLASSASVQTGNPDPVFVSIDRKLGKVVKHRVKNYETLYSISRLYGVESSTILRLNPKMRNKRHTLPPVLLVPIPEQQLLYRLPLIRNKSDYIAVYYEVQPKDNLFQISRIKFDMPTRLLKNRNDLGNETLSRGQTLHIGWIKRDVTPLAVIEGNKVNKEPPTSRPSDPYGYVSQFESLAQESQVVQKNQVAYWNPESPDSKGFFVMHRSLPERTIVEVTNPMYGTIAFGKVIGRIPSNLYPAEVDMVVSPDLAKELKVIDARFFVRIRYLRGPSTAN
ncbi:MAG: LysM peptidoglycan-binding domain-containing protein [Saprospiraceae bacterium]|nr:LysM peptidoglycan-binding domain-containing protein [Saprospiraceae bacterium]